MSRSDLEIAARLIQQKRYTEARDILADIDHPKAREWLARINAMRRTRGTITPVVKALVTDGWRVTSQTEKSASLEKKRGTNGLIVFLLAVISVGIFLFIDILWGIVAFIICLLLIALNNATQRSANALVSLQPDGSVDVTSSVRYLNAVYPPGYQGKIIGRPFPTGLVITLVIAAVVIGLIWWGSEALTRLDTQVEQTYNNLLTELVPTSRSPDAAFRPTLPPTWTAPALSDRPTLPPVWTPESIAFIATPTLDPNAPTATITDTPGGPTPVVQQIPGCGDLSWVETVDRLINDEQVQNLVLAEMRSAREQIALAPYPNCMATARSYLLGLLDNQILAVEALESGDLDATNRYTLVAKNMSELFQDEFARVLKEYYGIDLSTN